MKSIDIKDAIDLIKLGTKLINLTIIGVLTGPIFFLLDTDHSVTDLISIISSFIFVFFIIVSFTIGFKMKEKGSLLLNSLNKKKIKTY
ncbi:hypothetical protein CP965_01950 [Halarcobacter mediterraneus]|uniref:Uncharacterized protein n=1 Tax=Halarcobacter mediterraneus TaxID=2023153 RepID=A0A4Q1AVL9_9BACT|nr:hypothetical protein [Halarcobacter mediterraneus]RXK14234.1 hypothetical protein CP965_01950 [Halarcobacter mediterraneus]